MDDGSTTRIGTHRRRFTEDPHIPMHGQEGTRGHTSRAASAPPTRLNPKAILEKLAAFDWRLTEEGVPCLNAPIDKPDQLKFLNECEDYGLVQSRSSNKKDFSASGGMGYKTYTSEVVAKILEVKPELKEEATPEQLQGIAALTDIGLKIAKTLKYGKKERNNETGEVTSVLVGDGAGQAELIEFLLDLNNLVSHEGLPKTFELKNAYQQDRTGLGDAGTRVDLSSKVGMAAGLRGSLRLEELRIAQRGDRRK